MSELWLVLQLNVHDAVQSLSRVVFGSSGHVQRPDGGVLQVGSVLESVLQATCCCNTATLACCQSAGRAGRAGMPAAQPGSTTL